MSDNFQITNKKPVIYRSKPVATQVAEILRDRIARRQYGPNSQLPSETNLSEWLGVSRATVRTAMAALASEGLIIRKRGAGTFVNKRAVEVMSLTAWDFSRLIEDSGRKASILVLNADRRPATAREASLLQIDLGSEVISLVRIFLADEAPAIYSTNVLPVALVQVPHGADAYSKSIFDFLKEYCGQEYTYNTVDISSASADSKMARALKIEEGASIVRLDESFYNSEGLPLFVAENYFNDQVIRVRIVQRKPGL